MSGEEIAIILGALLGGGGIGAIITRIMSARRLDKKQEVGNFQILFNEISKDIARVRDEQREERKQWADERKTFSSEIAKLRDLIRTQDKQLHAKEIEVTQLTGKVDLLQSQLETYREARTASKS